MSDPGHFARLREEKLTAPEKGKGDITRRSSAAAGKNNEIRRPAKALILLFMETQKAHMQLIIQINTRGRAAECSAFRCFPPQVPLTVRQRNQSANLVGMTRRCRSASERTGRTFDSWFARVPKVTSHPRLRFRPFGSPRAQTLENPTEDPGLSLLTGDLGIPVQPGPVTRPGSTSQPAATATKTGITQ